MSLKSIATEGFLTGPGSLKPIATSGFFDDVSGVISYARIVKFIVYINKIVRMNVEY